MARIDSFLKLGLAQGCSDIHLAVGVPPMLRMNGDLLPIKFRDLSDTELESYVMEILNESQRENFSTGADLDFSYVGEDGGRFRVNLFRKVTGIGAVFRYIPAEVPTLKKLNSPQILYDFCDYHQGMVLVTGSTGTGKSTTMAAMIKHLNDTRSVQLFFHVRNHGPFHHPRSMCGNQGQQSLVLIIKRFIVLLVKYGKNADHFIEFPHRHGEH